MLSGLNSHIFGDTCDDNNDTFEHGEYLKKNQNWRTKRILKDVKLE